MSKMNRKLTAPEIQMRFNESHGKQISVSVVMERLQKAGLNGRISTKKPLLRRGNRKERLEWARVHKDWTVENWKQVLWTDESKFEIFGQKRRIYVRRGSSIRHIFFDHSSNFSKEENIKLMTFLKDYPIISKKTDHTSNQQKEAAWRLLADKFNSDATKFRSIKQLQQKYNNMKKSARKVRNGCRKIWETANWRWTTSSKAIGNHRVVKHYYGGVYQWSSSSAVYDSDAMRELPSSSGFDTSTPKAMLRKPVSKELSFIHKKKKTAFTPLETRKRIMIHSEKKIDLLSKKQGREMDLAQYAKEEHKLNMKHKEELHELELSFKKKCMN
ncbi:unnamed protein product [Euphydryas editha]|uniref:Regulatory protein zeste n=1 Tax=Euphydryas editha TaxID=104508 RepID=A0AAU9TQK4_EUPED|nr:unnamed protein product [Euphydryas editha]